MYNVLSKILSLGDRIEITKIVSDEKKQELIEEKSIFSKPLVSQLYDIYSDNQLKIAMPIVEGRVIPLPVNTRFNVCFFTSGGLYKSRFVVTERYKEDGLYILVIELISELKKYQRRQYYRLEYTMDIEYLVIENELREAIKNGETSIEEVASEGELKSGVVLDISGGGLRFISKELLSTEKPVILKLDLCLSNNKTVYGVVGNLLSSNKVENKDGIYEQRISYCDIEQSTRENIIRYIFEQERKLRQKQ